MTVMGIRMTGRRRVGPFILNFGRRGVSSVSFKVGPYTRNLTRGTSSVDLPGPFSYRTDARRGGYRGSAPVASWPQIARLVGAGLAVLGIPATAALVWLWHVASPYVAPIVEAVRGWLS